MQAILLREPLQFERIEVAEPDQAGSGEALVQVHRVGICGTDISGYLGKMPFYSYPRIPGHELGVEVIAVGPDVSNVKPGDRCSVEPYLNCRHCYDTGFAGGSPWTAGSRCEACRGAGPVVRFLRAVGLGSLVAAPQRTI